MDRSIVKERLRHRVADMMCEAMSDQRNLRQSIRDMVLAGALIFLAKVVESHWPRRKIVSATSLPVSAFAIISDQHCHRPRDCWLRLFR